MIHNYQQEYVAFLFVYVVVAQTNVSLDREKNELPVWFLFNRQKTSSTAAIPHRMCDIIETEVGSKVLFIQQERDRSHGVNNDTQQHCSWSTFPFPTFHPLSPHGWSVSFFGSIIFFSLLFCQQVPRGSSTSQLS